MILPTMTNFMADKYQIKAFVRPDDGAIFSLNKDDTTYSLKWSKEEFHDAIHHEYTKECLLSHDFIPIYE